MNSQLAQTAPITNTEVALRRLGGDTKLFATLARFFLQDAPGLMQQLHDAHRTGAVEVVFQSAHSLKGLAATFEALPFVELAAEVESLARAGDLSVVEGLISPLDFEFRRLVTELQNSAA
ncbi:MAG: Hpt domain-containing protein [Planctomycetota bacterium]